MPEIVSRRQIYNGTLLDLEIQEIEYEGGTRKPRETVHHIPGVAVVALLEQSEMVPGGTQVVLVRQFRPAVEEEVLELVAGLMDAEGESPLETAKRELREETGYEAEAWIELGQVLSSPGFTDEAITLFIARDLTLVGSDREEGEELALRTVPLTLALENIQKGEIRDVKTVAGLLWAARYLEAERAG